MSEVIFGRRRPYVPRLRTSMKIRAGHCHGTLLPSVVETRSLPLPVLIRVRLSS